MIPVANTRYQIRLRDDGYHVVRPTSQGGCFIVAGPYASREEAEGEARRRASARRAA